MAFTIKEHAVPMPTGMQATNQEIASVVDGQTVASMFNSTVAHHGTAPALRNLVGDDWSTVTYAELADQVARVGAALGALGVGHGDRVVLMMRNRPEFHVIDLAVLFCGATPVSIYSSSSTEQIVYLAGHCDAVVAIVEDDEYLARFVSQRSALPKLRHLVILERGTDTPDDVLDYAELVANDPIDLEEAVSVGSPDDLATLIYTSGTTGQPKAVMLTNRNICWTLESLRQCMGVEDEAWKVVSYLPMAHIAERMTSHYMMIAQGFEVSTCPDPSQLAAYLQEVRPNMLFGVPRVYEKLHAGVVAALSADTEKFAQFNEGLAAGLPIAMRRAWGEATVEDDTTWEFLDGIAFAPIRQLLGLDELVVAVTGAAPMSAELLGWFRAIGVPLTEIYGMSESSGPMSWAPYLVKPGTVGPTIPGQELRLGVDGEVLVRGGNVFVGYLGEPDKTRDALDEDGWLHSGDIGELDDDGYLRIVDRKKELIVTAGGKNISPANLEASLKNIPLVGQAFAVGDKRKYVTALVTLDPDVAPVWATQHGYTTDLETLARMPEVRAEIESGLAKAMEPFNHAEQVKKITILSDEWLPDTDLLTPTSKLKRRGILARYDAEIEAMYA